MVICLIFVIVPIGVLIINAFTRNGRFSFGNFIQFFTDSTMLDVFGRSFFIAGMTTLLCLIVAYPLAMILANSKINKLAILVLLFVLPMWINSLLRTYAMKVIFDDFLGLRNDYLRVIIAMAYDFFPLMLLPLYTVMVSMDKSYSEAASDLGANSFMVFLKVTLPLSLPGIMSGAIMVFMPSLSNFAITRIVAISPHNVFLLGNLIHGYFVQTGEQDLLNMGAVYSLVLLAIVMITMTITSKITGKKLPKGRTGGLLG
jgi:spermidine/putrescine transport system permease protein